METGSEGDSATESDESAAEVDAGTDESAAESDMDSLEAVAAMDTLSLNWCDVDDS